jgi:hypothetical protein
LRAGGFGTLLTYSSCELELLQCGYGHAHQSVWTWRQLAELIREVLCFSGELCFDARKPEGTSRASCFAMASPQPISGF